MEIRAITHDFVDITQEYPRLLFHELGTFPDYQHEILLTDDAVPSAEKLRPVHLARRQKVSEEVQNMDDLGIWEATDKSSWFHHMVTVPKPNGDYRITKDSTLNRYVILDRFRFSNPNEPRSATVFTNLDLRKAFFHIELAPDSIVWAVNRVASPYSATVVPQLQLRTIGVQLATSASDAQGLHSRGPYRVGGRVFARQPQIPLNVVKVLGNWTYRLSDGQTCNTRKLRRHLEPEAPLLHHHDTMYHSTSCETLSTPEP
ncbi:hypothetical protein PoB_006135800 [Plakobranchus ocellatus]|uniref:Reverse transcriptase domain-containing protein n=1 Tax=Plakobranchus ocellatus TaxID=259542 RepID=A0AAV4CSK3_9GAST|nr:hypothetical protein PoB_006135800 [Plakobranchus ocellatus]